MLNIKNANNYSQSKASSSIANILKIFKSMLLFKDFKIFRIPLVIARMKKEVYPAAYCLISQGMPISKIYIVTKGSFTLKYSYSTIEDVDFTIDHFIPYQNYTKASFNSLRNHEIKGKQTFSECDKVLIYSQSDMIGDIEWVTSSPNAFFSIYSNEEGSEVYSCDLKAFINIIDNCSLILKNITIEKMIFIQKRVNVILNAKNRFMTSKKKLFYNKLSEQTKVFQKLYRIEKENIEKSVAYSFRINRKTRNSIISSKANISSSPKKHKCLSTKSKDVPLNNTMTKQFKVYSNSTTNMLNKTCKDNKNQYYDLYKDKHLNDSYTNDHNKNRSFLTNSFFHKIKNKHQHKPNNQFRNKNQKKSIKTLIKSDNDILKEPMESVFIEYEGKIHSNIKSPSIKRQIIIQSPSYDNVNKLYRHKLHPEKCKKIISFNEKDLIIDKHKSRQFIVEMNNYFKYTAKFYINNSKNTKKKNNSLFINNKLYN